MKKIGLTLAFLASGYAASTPVRALDLAAFERGMTVETLDNGLTILIYERRTAPVVSFFTHVDVGSAQEVPGITGLAHMFEHMAFKGTSVIGTTDNASERRALEAVDAAYGALDHERRRTGGPDPAKLAELERAFAAAEDVARKFVVPNEFSDLVDRAGGSGLNAFTNADSTGYMFSLPANKLELGAYLESERYLDPVLREFYKERDVVMEERRMRTESQPLGRMIEQALGTAFLAHPYGQPTVGYMSDLQSFTRQDAQRFLETHYVPSNLTIAVVGDVSAETTLPLLRKYFGRMPVRPLPPPVRTVEPRQTAERTVVMPDSAQPLYFEGYHRPAATHADDAVYDAIADLLSTGRTSRLYRSLVRDQQIAASASTFNGFPGDKYPALIAIYAVPSPGHDNSEVQAAIRAELERLKTEPVGDAELRMVKTRAKADLIRSLESNMGIARQIAQYHRRFGDWRELFRAVDRIDRVTTAEIQRVARETFVPTNRTVAMVVNQSASAQEGTAR